MEPLESFTVHDVNLISPRAETDNPNCGPPPEDHHSNIPGPSTRLPSTKLNHAEPMDTDSLPSQDVPRIKVVVRKRPLNSRETLAGESSVVFTDSTTNNVKVAEPKLKVDLTKFVHNHDFNYDAVFDENANNMEIYTECCQPLIQKVFQKCKATCFAYGQTGSGKSYTMLGTGTENPGMYSQAARDIFGVLRNPKYDFLYVQVSFYEIYGGKLYDLLNARNKIVAREDGKQRVNIVNLTTIACRSSQEVLDVIANGTSHRQTGSTGANNTSSRSHAILSIDLKVKNTHRLHGRFSFIDLAGSERGADTYSNSKQTRKEGAEINKSLLALKECIRALDQKHAHKPFRGSKLTQVLKESFIGNAFTLMIANVSPNSGSVEHTLNSLRYADRVKELKSSKQNRKDYNAYMPHKGGGGGEAKGTKSGASTKRTRPAKTSSNRGPGCARMVSSGTTSSRPTSAESKNVSKRPGSSQARQASGIPMHRVKSDKSLRGSRVTGGVTARRSGSKQTTTSRPSSKRNEPTNTGRRQDTGLTRSKQSSAKLSSKSSAKRRANEAKHRPVEQPPPGITRAPPLEETGEFADQEMLVSTDDFRAEDNLVKAHRNHIDECMVLVKRDMQLLKEFDRMSVNTENYVRTLTHLLKRKGDSMLVLRKHLEKLQKTTEL